MDNIEFVVGEDYLIHIWESGDFTCTYTGKQVLPRIGGEWETFFRIVGNKDIQELYRIRFLLKEVISTDGKIELVNGSPEEFLIDGSEKHKPLVQKWLEQRVRPILEKRGYRRSESFRKYFDN